MTDINRRTVVLQGGLLKVLSNRERVFPIGGGRRNSQQGHGPRSEKRLYDFLLTCKPASHVLWLTYPDIRGPENVEKNVKAFLRRLAKRYDANIPALAKMETQQRLSPEVGIILWNNGQVMLNDTDIARLWSKTIKVNEGNARVHLERIRAWNKLISYISKQVTVGKDGIWVGKQHHDFLEPTASQQVLRSSVSHPQIANDVMSKYMDARSDFQTVVEAWREYKGRYYWKHHRAHIPKHKKMMETIDDSSKESIREHVNKTRRRYFVGQEDHITLRGEDAIAFKNMLHLGDE